MIFNLIATLIIGLISGFIGAITGGGGLISMPFLIFLGLSPQIALATGKFGGMGLSFGGLFKYIKEKKIIWEYAIVLSVFGILGSLIGSRILLTTNATILQKLIGILLIVMIPTIFINRDFGLNEKTTSLKRKIFGCIFYFLISILASFLGGLGIITISIVIYFFGLTMIKANATELFSYSIFSLSAVLIYAFNGIIDYRVGVIFFLGMLVGGYLGAHTAIKKGDKWVKLIFLIIVFASAIKILLN